MRQFNFKTVILTSIECFSKNDFNFILTFGVLIADRQIAN